MTSLDLAGEWRLIRVSTNESFPARVPGDTHSALLAEGKIPDPYQGLHELDVQWVGREDWAYERAFHVEEDALREERVELAFDCLDTLADVFVNGRRVGSADNMFVRWVFDARPLLTRGPNTLRVQFASAENAAARAAAALPYPIPHSRYPVQSPHHNLVRKAQCHAGWDWGPCLMVAGIPGAVSLDAWSDVRIDYVYDQQRHESGACTVTVTVECQAARAAEHELRVAIGAVTEKRRVTLSPGFNRASVDVVVPEPKLWWPNGSGPAHLYDLTVSLGSHTVRRQIGLRTVELVNRKDEAGLSMTIRVNGRDIFCKGANWVPPDALPQRESLPRLQHLLDSAARAHMNMLRVWGGGRYETDDFYRLCDQEGILVWQDMMFACSLYPSSPSFLASVEREVRHQVKRLRHHPCIALWCGNNEDVGALTWFAESKSNRDRYLVDYDRLNEGVIGRVVDECDPTRAFWPSSPSSGRGDYSDNWHDDRRGDMHYWTVWHEGRPFSAYYEVTPRFCSEFGYQSFPSLRTIRSYAGEDDLNAASPVMEHHQRHPRGNSAITEMFTRYFRVPEGFDSFVYLSQVQQALAIKTAVEYWRSLRPVCMGTLYWQLNDNWPVCSWSSIEYDGTWKLLHHAARRFFAPVLLCAWQKDGRVELALVNDLPEEAPCRATLSVVDLGGTNVFSESWDVRAPAGGVTRLKSWAREQLSTHPDDTFVSLTLEHGGETSRNELLLVEPKRMALPRARVAVDVQAAPDGCTVTLATDVPAFYVALESGDFPGEFSDNCFTLLPGAPRTVTFRPVRTVSLPDLHRSIRARHLRETYR